MGEDFRVSYKNEFYKPLDKSKGESGSVVKSSEQTDSPSLFWDDPDCKDSKYVGAVLDVFENKSVDLNGDYIPDVPHGEVVSSFFTNPDICLKKISIDYEDYSIFYDSKKLLKGLKDLNTYVDEGNRLDFINISACNYSKIKDLNIDSDRVKNALVSQASEGDEEAVEVLAIINNLEELSKKGVKIFLAGGNKPEKFNLYSLADGTTSVGALNRQGCIHSGASNTNLINAYDTAVFKIRKKRLNFHKDSYDVNGDRKTDFILDHQSKFHLFRRKLTGTSFSTPKYANNFFSDLVAE